MSFLAGIFVGATGFAVAAFIASDRLVRAILEEADE